MFVYGTLKDEEVCRLLFNENVIGEEAVLQGYSLRKTSDFLFITPHPGGVVLGNIIRLTDDQLLIADQWEEVPYYTRKRVQVLVATMFVSVWTYTRDGVEGENAIEGELSSLSRKKLLKVIENFNKEKCLVQHKNKGKQC